MKKQHCSHRMTTCHEHVTCMFMSRQPCRHSRACMFMDVCSCHASHVMFMYVQARHAHVVVHVCSWQAILVHGCMITSGATRTCQACRIRA